MRSLFSSASPLNTTLRKFYHHDFIVEVSETYLKIPVIKEPFVETCENKIVEGKYWGVVATPMNEWIVKC